MDDLDMDPFESVTGGSLDRKIVMDSFKSIDMVRGVHTDDILMMLLETGLKNPCFIFSLDNVVLTHKVFFNLDKYFMNIASGLDGSDWNEVGYVLKDIIRTSIAVDMRETIQFQNMAMAHYIFAMMCMKDLLILTKLEGGGR